MLPVVTAELPPPSGPPQPNPDVDAPPPATAPTAPVYAAPPPMMPPGGPAPAAGGLPPMGAMPSSDSLSFRPVPTPGTNGLAIAALCCGIAGILPVAAVVGIVLGFVALGQLRRRIQSGRGLAIAGIVLGALWLVGWVVLLVTVPGDAPTRSASAVASTTPRPSASTSASPAPSATSAPPARTQAYIDEIKAGDCFSGGRTDTPSLVTIIPCTEPHESQAVLRFDLPAGRFPGEKAVVAAAEKGCTDKADPLITDRAYNELDPSFFYPSDAYSWRGDRAVVCLVEAPKGTTTGTALR